MSNNDLLFQIKQFQADHEAIKIKMLHEYDKLLAVEQRFTKVITLLVKRLKGNG